MTGRSEAGVAVVGVRHTVLDSPVGELTLVADGGALAGLYFAEHRRRPDSAGWGERVDEAAAVFESPARQLREYFDRRRTAFDLELAPRGDKFDQRVWKLLSAIPYGRTRSYGELARELGDPGLAQAVGAAVGRNPLSVVVPCHRVVGADGGLTGYAGGLWRKRVLLDLENASSETAPRLL